MKKRMKANPGKKTACFYCCNNSPRMLASLSVVVFNKSDTSDMSDMSDMSDKTTKPSFLAQKLAKG